MNLFLPCAAGVEDMLAAETKRIAKIAIKLQGTSGGGRFEVRTARGGVMLINAQWVDVMAVNLHSRLCQRVLILVSRTPYRVEDDIYQAACDVQWEHWFTPRHTFKIDLTASRSPLQSINFAALRIKDGLCDRFRHFESERPSVDTVRPDARVHAHLSEDELSLYIDTSGEPLFKRGWRFDKGDAPLKETLAAAMLEASGWAELARNGEATPLVDPCCGSGTISIEAAQMLIGMPPGLRRPFGFERLLPHQADHWTAIKKEASEAMNTLATMQKSVKNGGECVIFGSDLSFRMVDFANTNAERAGVADWLNFRGGDALQRAAPSSRAGVIVMNPPYGERIEARGVAGANRAQSRAQRGEAKLQHPFERDFQTDFERDTTTRPPASDPQEPSQRKVDGHFFAALATHWKRGYPGWTAWVLSPDMKLPGAMRFKESRRVPLWNGPIECRLFRFDLMSGSPRPQNPTAPPLPDPASTQDDAEDHWV